MRLSAYTDIARGTAKLFGIDLIINFRAPCFARDPSDFWQRWHISLSTWLRDYLYIPLGGNRKGPLLMYRSLMLTMVLGGLWHGAAWNFVVWGLYQGLLLCGFRVATIGRSVRSKHPSPCRWGRVIQCPIHGLGIVLFFQLVCYGWILFRADSFDQIVSMTRDLLTFSGWSSVSIPRPPLATLLGLMFLIPWEALTFWTGSASLYSGWHPSMRGAIVSVIIILLVMGLNNNASTFIYFQF